MLSRGRRSAVSKLFRLPMTTQTADIRCFATEAHGITSYVWTTTKGKAIAATVMQANDAGYRTLWVEVKCLRRPGLDDYELLDNRIRLHRCYSPDFIQHNCN